MGCKLINSSNPPILCQFSTRKPSFGIKTLAFSSYKTELPTTDDVGIATIKFKTLAACKLGISRYPDFEYDAQGGTGTGRTTKFLGLPLPPLLKIDIVPQLFQGNINPESGQSSSIAGEDSVTTEESKGSMRSGRGERLDKEGKCRLVGVATVDPIDDFFMNTFLGLPTQCLANLNALIALS
ncbi:hypothetical protein JRO89_XS11G0182000 [Xanthoceras sorbifolium]|uniref:Uncharacterized protein n=1 Tax=Xanthoceras sorbifolium TaxID=99658 RepID=A0ABQ8HG38_9ROSI|nr:hypothetical protein JRO89_XS11G0182000 [Xanthoceras sorbifolium]